MSGYAQSQTVHIQQPAPVLLHMAAMLVSTVSLLTPPPLSPTRCSGMLVSAVSVLE